MVLDQTAKNCTCQAGDFTLDTMGSREREKMPQSDPGCLRSVVLKIMTRKEKEVWEGHLVPKETATGKESKPK